VSDKNSKKQTPNSTASKQSTVQATDSAKNKQRWFRQSSDQSNLPELNHLFDLYWGGPERRITGLTLKIISVNMIALIMLLVGVLYLGQYQNSIIQTKLENFEREAKIIASALSTMDSESVYGRKKIAELISGSPQTIKIFDQNGKLISEQKSQFHDTNPKKELQSIKTLKNTASFLTGILPDTTAIAHYPFESNNTPDLNESLAGFVSFSAWEDKNEEILLSVGIPIKQSNENAGAVIIIRYASDIKDAIGDVWKGILKIFMATLLITIILSIYLAGAIARPLKKLANAAEAVRTGYATGEDIPDFSHRLDEIGDLSVVLRSMTDALWEKMDSIESFAADVAHELKNPLTSLSSAIETLEKVKKKEDREKLLGIINHDIKRMDRLITDISSASRLDAELSRETFINVSIDTLLLELLDSYKDPILREEKTQNQIRTANGCTIKLNIKSDKNLTTKGSKTRLEQVFQNLIDNALSFSKENETITITVNRGENLIAIHIDDEGIGIPEKKLQSIFDRFYTERPAEFYGQNSGLGLSICKQIIESHRGEIFAENRHDEKGNVIGARFNVILKANNNG